MISLTTAKFILFVALCLGPKYGDNNHTIQITNTNSYCLWTQQSDGWTVSQKGISTNDWPVNGTALSTQELNDFGQRYNSMVRAISHHDWKKAHILYFDNGDIVEKRGDTAFYTINAGAQNQQIFTIQTLANGKPF